MAKTRSAAFDPRPLLTPAERSDLEGMVTALDAGAWPRSDRRDAAERVWAMAKSHRGRERDTQEHQSTVLASTHCCSAPMLTTSPADTSAFCSTKRRGRTASGGWVESPRRPAARQPSAQIVARPKIEPNCAAAAIFGVNSNLAAPHTEAAEMCEKEANHDFTARVNCPKCAGFLAEGSFTACASRAAKATSGPS